jgi:hypothetical protein
MLRQHGHWFPNSWVVVATQHRYFVKLIRHVCVFLTARRSLPFAAIVANP